MCYCYSVPRSLEHQGGQSVIGHDSLLVSVRFAYPAVSRAVAHDHRLVCLQVGY